MSNDESIRSIAPSTLQEIAAGTSSEIGERFFDALVQHLALAVGTKYAWVTEWLPDERELQALSFWTGEQFLQDYRYAVAGSPCERVIDERRLVHIPDHVVDLFPHDETLRSLAAAGYMAVPLLDAGKVLGHLAVMDDKRMPESSAASSILSIFAGRATAELLRLRSERALRERENKLSRLFEGAMDAILEFDAELHLTNLNHAAAKGIGLSVSEANGRPVSEFLTSGSNNDLQRFIDELNQKSDTEHSLWIPNGIEVIPASGSSFPAEATLSRYEADGKIFHALVFRNIRERLQAEERVRSLVGETEYLRNEIEALSGFDEIVGSSSAIRRVLIDVAQVADADSTVLITGETGTGKELIARAIHRRSHRASGPLITVNCAAISANLQESEFFGHEKGSFTGAAQRRDGRFKLAHGGTIFLDEVGEMPLDLQAKLLRVLQEGEFEPVGSSRTIKVDVRVIAATNRDLVEMTKAGTFRSDLLYRLNVFPLHLPPLRERREDVLLLAEMFAAKLARKQSRTIAPMTETMKHRLLTYDWPGNVRELQNVIERAFITSIDGKTLNLDRALPLPEVPASSTEISSLPIVEDKILRLNDLKELERRNIERALIAAGGRISGSGGAADLLGLHANTLTSRMRSLGISKNIKFSKNIK